MKPKVKIKVGTIWRGPDPSVVSWWDGECWRVKSKDKSVVLVDNNGKAYKK